MSKWFTWNDWRLGAIAGGVLLVGIVVMAVLLDEPTTEESEGEDHREVSSEHRKTPTRTVKATPTATVYVRPSLPVSRGAIVDVFESEFGFQFENEMNTGLFAGIDGIGPMGDMELLLTGRPYDLYTVSLNAVIESEEEAVLANEYIVRLLEVSVPTWTGSTEWYEGVAKKIGGIQSMESFVANPEPGIEVSMLAIPPPPGLTINLQIAAYD